MSNTSGRFDRGLYGALLALVWAWVALFSTSAYGASADKVRLQLKWYHQFQFAGYYAAQSRGFYKDEGLDVEIFEGAPDKSPEKVVLARKAEFGVHDGADLTFRRLQGDSVVALAAIFQHSPYVIISKQSTAIRHPSDLVGRKVLITQDQGSAQILAMFRREGIKVNSTFDEKPVRFVPHSWNVEDLIEDRADAMTAYVTEIARFKRQYDFDAAILNPLDYGIDFYGDTLFTSSEYLKAEPGVVERFRRASLRGWEYAMANPEAIAGVILALPSTRQNKPGRQALMDEAQAMDDIVLPKLVEMGNMNDGRWEKMAKTYQELGMASSISNLKGFTYERDAEKRNIQRQVQLLGAFALCVALLAVGSLVWLRVMRSQVRVRTLELTNEVCERKQAQEALLESEQNLSITLQSIGDAVIATDTLGRVTRMNPAAERLCGWTLADALGHPLAEVFCIVNAGTREPMSDPVQLVMAHGEVVGLANHTVLLAKDGHEYQIADSAAPIRNAAGATVGVVLVFSDVTQKYAAQEEIEESHERYRALSEAAFEAIFISEKGVCLEQNSRAEQIFGYTLTQAIGRMGTEWIAPTDRDLVMKHMMAGYEQPYEVTGLRKDGSTFPAIIRGKMMHYRNRDVRVTSMSDIAQLKQAELALKQSEERWKFAIEGSGDGLWDWNIQTGQAFYSPRYKTMLGFTDDEIGDTADEWTKRIHPDDAPGVMAAMQPYMDGKPGSATVEFRMLCKDGSWRFIMGRGMVVERDAQGKPLRMIGINTDITERREHQDQLERIAHFDALTNLPNRVLLADRLQQAMAQAHRRDKQLAVAYLDLDGFKVINDQHGHAVGDQVLITLAQRMKQALREGDTLARLGGDEFVAVLIDLEDMAASVPMLDRLLAAAAKPIQVGSLTLHISGSLGVTFYPQAQDIDADQLLRQADQAMYQAKVAGKNRYHFFDAEQDSNIRGRHESVDRIRLAMKQHELVLHYQPKVNMRSGQIIGAEALIRWQHPEKGLLAPALFLPEIEDHPLAIAIGEWVIDTALTQMELWQVTGLDMNVSVNIGARQLQQSDFVDRLKFILAKHPQVNPTNLELEVLETSALEDIAQVSDVIEDCAQIGVKFALDDFGTGYSSLTYLKQLRVAMLKIDQSFVRDMLEDPDDLAILQGIIGLAESFKRQVIAEGVETVAHGSLLLQLGCELAQGYGIARPMPADQLPGWAVRWQPDAAWCALPWLGGLDTEW